MLGGRCQRTTRRCYRWCGHPAAIVALATIISYLYLLAHLRGAITNKSAMVRHMRRPSEKEGRDRVVEMWRARMRATGGGEGKKEEADAKFAVANDLRDQGEDEEALELYYQAVELYTQVGHRPVSGGIGWNGEDAALLRSLCGPGRAGSFFVQELWYPRDAYLGRALSRGARVRAVFAAVPAPRSQAPEA